MPTPVNTARQCLTEEAARVLDDAVSVARRRSHVQTTSLHVVSALLAMPTSVLRDVCIARSSRNSPYSSRLQLRALELCVSVALDRVPSSKSPAAADEEPPLSNSLMAAIKRSQANQRRHPESYHLHQIHHSSGGGGGAQTTAAVIRVELKYLILSILDDPIVSRVFNDAGYRSSEIKLDVLHPPMAQFSSRFPQARYPPLFLCNLPDSDPVRPGCVFPFGGNGEVDENFRRIGDVLSRKAKKNPVLVGVYANEALKTFMDLMNRGKLGFLPLEFTGVTVVSIEKQISEILNDGSKEEEIRKNLDELEKIIQKKCTGSGVILNLGEFKALTHEASSSSSNGNALGNLVSKLSGLLELHRGNLWFIGSISSLETFPQLLDRFPTIETNWDLHVLPITPTKPSGGYPKSSLMGSFVPFGGFFASTSDFRVPFNNTTNQPMPRCHLCNEKYEQEVTSLIKLGSSYSVDDQCSNKLPSWLRSADPKNSTDTKVKDDTNLLGSQMAALQKKWDDICQTIHHSPAFPNTGLQPVRTSNLVRNPSEQIAGISNTKIPSPFSFQSGLSVQVLKPKHSEDLNRSTSSPLSCVTTDLGLGTIYVSSSQEPKTPISLDQGEFRTSSENSMLLTPLLSSAEQMNPKDFKSLREFLSKKVSWQSEAVNAISEILCGYKIGSTRNVWLALLGPDKMGKKKIASALAELFFDSHENVISADFQAQDCVVGDKFRGKTIVDYISEELERKPHSVVFLENIEKAEFPDQISLSDAVRTGKLRNSYGREINMKNVIVVLTSRIVKDSNGHVLDSLHFSEDRVAGAKSGNKLQIKLSEVVGTSLNKRKHHDLEKERTEPRAQKAQRSFLDLNLPLEETEADCNETETDTMSENTQVWLEEFLQHVDGKLKLKPFDFDGLAKNIQRNIIAHFYRSFGSEIHLEIDDDVIVQILAAVWSSEEDKTFDQWLQNVLFPRFLEARQKYGSSPRSAVKLVACEGFPAEEHAAGVKFPARIDVL